MTTRTIESTLKPVENATYAITMTVPSARGVLAEAVRCVRQSGFVPLRATAKEFRAVTDGGTSVPPPDPSPAGEIAMLVWGPKGDTTLLGFIAPAVSARQALEPESSQTVYSAVVLLAGIDGETLQDALEQLAAPGTNIAGAQIESHVLAFERHDVPKPSDRNGVAPPAVWTAQLTMSFASEEAVASVGRTLDRLRPKLVIAAFRDQAILNLRDMTSRSWPRSTIQEQSHLEAIALMNIIPTYDIEPIK